MGIYTINVRYVWGVITILSLLEFCVYLALLTSSFDIFLAFQLGGTIRFAYIIIMFPTVYAIYYCLKTRKVYFGYYVRYLFIWSAFLLVFLVNTNYLSRTIGYQFWLLLNIAIILMFMNVPFNMNKLMKVYIISFFFVAVFGIMQFGLAPFLNFDTPLVQQWWIPGILPRINGFSYEPSYFATYLIIGWTLTYCMINFQEYSIFGKKIFIAICAVETIAMILSSSRMGIALMVLIMLLPKTKKLLIFLRGLCLGKISMTLLRNIIFFICFLFGMFTVLYLNFEFDEYMFLLQGTGIGGTAAHSYDTRYSEFLSTIAIFADNPILGVSLGGISENMPGFYSNASYKVEGMCVFAEVLAASGIIGVVPFVAYFYLIVRDAFKLSSIKNDKLLLALILSLLSELVILQFNQNILRPYFWLHIGILSAYYRYCLLER